jgi:prefoldin subunit 5
MYEKKIQNFHNQLVSEYEKLASSQSSLLEARKQLHKLREDHRDLVRGRGDMTVVMERSFVETLRREIQNVNHDTALCMEEVEEIKRETATLKNTLRNCEGAKNPVVEDFTPRNKARRTNLRAKFADESELVRVVPSSESSDKTWRLR